MTQKRDPLKADFRNFLYRIWKHLGLPDPTPAQYEMAHYLQHGADRMVIMAFRGIGKSWITSAYVLWRLYCNPEERFLVVSASKDRAIDFSTFTLRLIHEVEFLQHLIPGRDQRSSKLSFDVGPSTAAHAPSVKAVGVTGQLSGTRATEIIADDIEIPNNSATQEMRDKLFKAISEFEAIIVPKVGKIKFLGTPQTEESVYNKVRAGGYDCRIWPARVPNDEQLEAYNGALAPTITEMFSNGERPGTPTDPDRFDDIDLVKREALYGRSGFALQFMLDTSLSDALKYPLKTADFMVFDTAPDQGPVSIQYGSGPDQLRTDIANVGFTGDKWYSPLYYDKDKWTKYEGVVMGIDPAGRGLDETSYAIVAMLHGTLYVLEVGGFKGGYDDAVLVMLAKKAKQYGVNDVVVESNFGDGMFTKIFQPVLNRYRPCRIEEVRSFTQKEARIIETLEPALTAHRVVLNRQIIVDDLEQIKEDQKYSLLFQLTRLTREKGCLAHDDRIDALSMAVKYWTDLMDRDEAKAEEQWRERHLQEELRKHMDFQVLRRHQKPQNDTLLNIRNR